MTSTQRRQADRAREAELVSTELLPRVALLSRLLARQLRGDLTRTEASLLKTVSDCPRRITELAELEGLAQPTTTQLVKRLEREGLVSRDQHPADGRVVVVSITEEGASALADFRARATAKLREYLEQMSDAQVSALATTTKCLGPLIDLLQQGAPE
jgi:DNA-binding MarR family transcriptional regulator